jgi:hypothetical protein
MAAKPALDFSHCAGSRRLRRSRGIRVIYDGREGIPPETAPFVLVFPRARTRARTDRLDRYGLRFARHGPATP